MKLIIAVTTDVLFDERVKRIAESLLDLFDEVLVVGRKKQEHGIVESFPFTIHWLPCIFKKGFLFYAEFNIRLFFFLLFRSHRKDIINACDLDTVFAVCLSSMAKRNRWTFDAHEFFEEVPELANRPMVKKIWSLIGAACIPYSSLCYTVSASLAEIFTEKYNKEFYVIRNLPSNEFQDWEIFPKANILYYQGALNKGRGLECLIRSMVDLPEYKLLLAGNGDLDNDLRNQVHDLGLGGQVIFLGRLTYPEMVHHAAQARIGFNLCDTQSKSYYYSLNNKTFEYIQALLPAVHMDMPEFRKLRQQYNIGLLLPDLSTLEIIKAVRYFENSNHYLACVSACKQARTQFHWKNEAPQLTRVYNMLSLIS